MRPGASWHLQAWVILGAATWFAGFAVFPRFFGLAGITHYGVWFIDSFAILAANDAISLGLDPHRANPLDYFNRPHVYTHWWLALREFGLTREHNFWVGVTLCLGFFLAAVSRLLPRTPAEGLWYLAILGSVPILLALNRANNDLVIFIVLAPVVPCLLDKRRLVRLFAVVLIAFATGLKYYPVTAGLVLLAGAAGGKREVRARLVLAALALALVAANLAPDLAGVGRLTPKAEGFLTFGAGNLPGWLGLSARAASLGGLAIAVAAVGFFLRSRWFEGWVIAPEDRSVWWSFILGAVLLTGCFFTGTSFAYRWVFALWLAPLLWRLPRDGRAPVAVRRLAAVTGGLLMFALWGAVVARAIIVRVSAGRTPEEITGRVDTFFIGEQLFLWALFLCLLGFLTHFTRQGVRAARGSESV